LVQVSLTLTIQTSIILSSRSLASYLLMAQKSVIYTTDNSYATATGGSSTTVTVVLEILDDNNVGDLNG